MSKSRYMKKYTLVIHGGAGAIPFGVPDEIRDMYLNALDLILSYGKQMLENGSSSLDTVVKTVNKFEECPLFNCGKGSVFDHYGKHSMDASLMDGRNRNCGAVTGISRIANPISLAKDVMERTKYIFLNGKGAEEFAKTIGYRFKNRKYFYTEKRYDQWLKVKDSSRISLDHNSEFESAPKGTVGAVALDMNGDLAAATSTGGMTNKEWDRIGDSPIIGAGTFADNSTCAVSCTGEGEEFIKNVTAYEVHSLMNLKNISLSEAALSAVKRLKNGAGGLIAVDRNGNYSMPYNSLGMYRGVADSSGVYKVSIWD